MKLNVYGKCQFGNIKKHYGLHIKRCDNYNLENIYYCKYENKC